MYGYGTDELAQREKELALFSLIHVACRPRKPAAIQGCGAQKLVDLHVACRFAQNADY